MPACIVRGRRDGEIVDAESDLDGPSEERRVERLSAVEAANELVDELETGEGMSVGVVGRDVDATGGVERNELEELTGIPVLPFETDAKREGGRRADDPGGGTSCSMPSLEPGRLSVGERTRLIGCPSSVMITQPGLGACGLGSGST